jgi:hypothetical protein
MVARTQDGRAFRILTILDEYSRECLNITVARKIKAQEVIYQLAELFIGRGDSGAHSFGQWVGVYGQSDSAVAKGSWSEDPVH